MGTVTRFTRLNAALSSLTSSGASHVAERYCAKIVGIKTSATPTPTTPLLPARFSLGHRTELNRGMNHSVIAIQKWAHAIEACQKGRDCRPTREKSAKSYE